MVLFKTDDFCFLLFVAQETVQLVKHNYLPMNVPKLQGKAWEGTKSYEKIHERISGPVSLQNPAIPVFRLRLRTFQEVKKHGQNPVHLSRQHLPFAHGGVHHEGSGGEGGAGRAL